MTVPRVTGNTAFDVIGIICTVLVLALVVSALVVGAGLFADWRASRRSVRPVGAPPAMPELVAPAVKKRRSPFAPKRKAGAQ